MSMAALGMSSVKQLTSDVPPTCLMSTIRNSITTSLAYDASRTCSLFRLMERNSEKAITPGARRTFVTLDKAGWSHCGELINRESLRCKARQGNEHCLHSRNVWPEATQHY